MVPTARGRNEAFRGWLSGCGVEGVGSGRHSGGSLDEGVDGTVGQTSAEEDEGPGAEADAVAGRGRRAMAVLVTAAAITEGDEDAGPRTGAVGEGLRHGAGLLGVGAVAGGGADLVCGDRGPLGPDVARFDEDDVMPNRFSSRRSASLSPSTANLLAWYQDPKGMAKRPPMELMMPLRRVRMCGSTSRVRWARPKRSARSGRGPSPTGRPE